SRVSSETVAISAAPAWRLSAAAAGGVVFDHGAHGLVSVAARAVYGARNLVGGELSLWLIDGSHAQGRGLLAFDRALGARFALGAGAGVHVGDGTGVAGALRLRVHTPLPMLDGVLRYDTAVLLTRPSVEAEHAITLGLELTFRGW